MTQVSQSSFDEVKAAETAFFFLSKAKQSDKHITKLRLVKWIYLAERLSYERYGEPIIGDKLYSMQHGPVLSNVLYLIESPSKAKSSPRGVWVDVVKFKSHTKHDYAAIAEDCPYKTPDDLRALSESEIDLLEEVWKNFGQMSAQMLETYLHNPDTCPEWNWRAGDGSKPIELENLLPILGYTEEQTAVLIKHLQAHEHIGAALAH